jgi:hypothetical protein
MKRFFRQLRVQENGMFISDFKGAATLRLILYFLLDLHGFSHHFRLMLLVEFIINFIVNIFFFGDRRLTRPFSLRLIDLCDQLFNLF